MRHIDEPFDNAAEIEDLISAYRLILGRNPDKPGFEHFKNQIENGGFSLDRLFSAFINSQEFKKRNDDENKIIEVDCGGYYVCVKKADKDFGSSIIKNKIWEPHIVNTISKILKKGSIFVDIGANVGVMTFHAAKILGESGKVIAFEPNPDNLQLLYRGILKNNTNNVYIAPFAASDKIKVFSLSGGTSNTHIITYEESHNCVQSIVLDDYLKSLDHIDLVKMDIEGHEPYALNGFRHLLKLHKSIIIIEFNPKCLEDISCLNPKECLNMIFDLFENVQVIEYSGTYLPFSNPSQLWAYWEERNKESVKAKRLPDGMLHFDLLAKAK